VVYRIRARCLNWRSVFGVLLDCRMSMKLKGKFYWTKNLQYVDQNV